MVPPSDNDRVNVGVLRAELKGLREFIGAKLESLTDRVLEACTRLEGMEDQVAANTATLQVHEHRLDNLTKFQDNLLSQFLKWSSVGAGVAITLVLVGAGIAKAAGWW